MLARGSYSDIAKGSSGLKSRTDKKSSTVCAEGLRAVPNTGSDSSVRAKKLEDPKLLKTTEANPELMADMSRETSIARGSYSDMAKRSVGMRSGTGGRSGMAFAEVSSGSRRRAPR
jgi:tryptophan 2,3-dioxygenase